MILTHFECIKKYKNDYQIKKAVVDGELFKLEKGIYSEQKYVPEIEIIAAKYPNAIMTMHSAFYYHSLTNVIPECYYLMTDKDDSKIKDKRVKQIFSQKELLELGVTEIKYQGIAIKVYDKERMLIELVRNKNKLPYDYYKDIILRYRGLVHELDIQRIQEYAKTFPKSGMITEILQAEVF